MTKCLKDKQVNILARYNLCVLEFAFVYVIFFTVEKK